jgi:NNP family nitrate/nitrite transporter-like MFS transporter
VALALATVGLGLNLRAWTLLGPHLHLRPDDPTQVRMLLLGLPLLVAALTRVPVGVLTDRYGARVMFPAVSLAAAGSMFELAWSRGLVSVAIAGAVSGVAGTAFVVGGSLVARAFPYGRRGRALGVFGLGPALAAGFSAAAWSFNPGGPGVALVLGVALVVFGGLAALVLPGDAVQPSAAQPSAVALSAVERQARPGPAQSSARRCLDLIRLAAATPLSILYALALGGITAVAVYLPVYLAMAFRLSWFRAVSITGVIVIIAAVGRLIGGWWTDRRPTARLLAVCYAIAATLCLVVALAPSLWLVVAPLIALIAVCDGIASGALLALIGKAARRDSVGAVMGVTGAAAAVGALAPPLLLAGVDHWSQSPALAWVLLAATLATVAHYVHRHGLGVGLGLAVRSQPPPSPTVMTVAVVDESDTDLGAAAVVSRLAELATSDELVVVYGSSEPVRPRLSANIVVTGLRERLPRHRVIGVRSGPYADAMDRFATILGEFVEAGAVAVAVAPTAESRGLAAELSSQLHADRVLKMSFTVTRGADLHEIWSRHPPGEDPDASGQPG